MSNYVIKTVDILLGNGQETFRSQKKMMKVVPLPLYFFLLMMISMMIVDRKWLSRTVVVITCISLLHTTLGLLQNQTTCSTDDLPASVAVGDFNNDNKLEIVVANLGSNEVCVSSWLW